MRRKFHGDGGGFSTASVVGKVRTLSLPSYEKADDGSNCGLFGHSRIGEPCHGVVIEDAWGESRCNGHLGGAYEKTLDERDYDAAARLGCWGASDQPEENEK